MQFSSNIMSLVILAATVTAAALDRRQTDWAAGSETTSAAQVSSTSTSSSSSIACNNSPSLCQKSFNSILHLGTHDTPFLRTSANNWATAGNQYYDVKTLLSAGVRLLQTQMQWEEGVARMCHTSCSIMDAGTLTNFLTDVKEWLDENPNEVVTLLLVNPDNIKATQLDPSFVDSGLADLIFVPTATGSAMAWPTLGDMIASKKRVVAFLSTTPQSSSYLIPEFSYIYETPYEVTNPSNFSCVKDRGNGPIPLINQFMYNEGMIQSPNETYSATINGDYGEGNMKDRLASCQVTSGFVMVDFFAGKKELEIVDAINGVTDATGRTAVPVLNRDGKNAEKDSAAGAVEVGWGALAGLVSVGVMMAAL